MKISICTLLFFSLSSVAFSCEQLESQFFGRVIDHQKTRIASGNACTYRISINKFDTSSVCPLRIEDTEERVLIDENCNYKNGQKISGVLVLRNRELFID